MLFELRYLACTLAGSSAQSFGSAVLGTANANNGHSNLSENVASNTYLQPHKRSSPLTDLLTRRLRLRGAGIEAVRQRATQANRGPSWVVPAECSRESTHSAGTLLPASVTLMGGVVAAAARAITPVFACDAGVIDGVALLPPGTIRVAHASDTVAGPR